MSLIKKLGTHLKVADVENSKAFYIALGFQPILEFGPGLERTNRTAPNKDRGVIFATDDGTALFEIADGHVAVKSEVFQQHIHSSKVSLMVFVDSLTEIINLAKQAGIPLAKEPVNYSWRTTEMVIRDPDGFIVVFIAPTNEEDKNVYPTI